MQLYVIAEQKATGLHNSGFNAHPILGFLAGCRGAAHSHKAFQARQTCCTLPQGIMRHVGICSTFVESI